MLNCDWRLSSRLINAGVDEVVTTEEDDVEEEEDEEDEDEEDGRIGI